MHRTDTRTSWSNLTSQAPARLSSFVVCVALAGVVLALDIALPLGFAGGIPYVAVVMLASRVGDARSVYVAAAACTSLVLAGYLLSDPGPDRAMAVANRVLTGFALWITAALMHGYTRSETALKDSQERFRSLYERAPAMLHSIDHQGRLVSVSDQWLKVMGYERDEVVGHELTEFMTEDGRDRARDSDLPAFYRSGRIDDLEYRFIRNDGTVLDVLLSAIARYDKRGRFAGSLAVLVDITDRKRAERALRDEKERAQVTLQSIGDAVITTDARGFVQYLNPAAESLAGWSNAEARGEPLQNVFRVVDERTRTMVLDPAATCLVSDKPVALAPRSILIARDGRERAIEDSASPIRGRDGEIHGVVVVFHDVTESRRLARKLAHQASHDPLTGLPNRREFERRLQRVLETTKIHGGEHALCYLDLDQFKVVNDTCGHIAGDELLRELRGVLEENTRKRDTLARLGGDEFGLLMEHCNLEQAARVADQLRRAVEEFRYVWEDKTFNPGVSIGLVPVTDDTTTVKDVLASADAACYAAKSAGRNRVRIYRTGDADLERHHGEIRWVTRIQRAIESDAFEIYLQPIVPVEGADDACTPNFFEALLRLHDESGKSIRPGAFLPAAERYDLSRRIDRWVVRTALRWLSDHDRFTGKLSALFINLSGRTLADERFLDFVNEEFARNRVSPGKICFEITETAAIGNLSSATRMIRALRAKGCLFALDDFGSGLSSLAYLKNLPVDFIKIDGAFVKDVDSDPVSAAMVRSINDISRVMDIRTIAEFVETERVLEALREIGVDHAQGYHIGRPRPLGLPAAPDEAQSG